MNEALGLAELGGQKIFAVHLAVPQPQRLGLR